MAQQTFEEIVAAVKQAESRGKRYADDGKTLTTSAKGALGEMQVMPKTIRDPGFGVTPAKDKSPDEIARVGKDYLQAMLSKYGDQEKALIAYNWGPGVTDKWIAAGANPEKLPAETRTYIERVKNLLGKDVPRETMAKKEREPLPPSLPPMAQADQPAPTKAPTATVMASAGGRNMPDIKSMPASYQAAFALSALADAQDDEDEKAYNENRETESEKLMREYKPVNHLASLDLSVKPITMKDGGEVDAEDRPDDIKYFSNVNRMKERGTTTDSVMLGARTKAGEGSFVAGLNMANMSRDEKMQTARALMLAYTQQDPEGLGFSANIVKPQGAPAMASLMGSLPLGEGRVSAGMQGNQAYSLGYSQPLEGGQFNANLNVPRGTMGSPQLNLQYNKRFADGGEVEQERLTPQQMEQYVGQKTKAELLLEKFKEQAHPRNYTSIIGLGPNMVYEAYKYATGKDPLRDFQKELQKKIDYEVDTDLEPIGTSSGPISGSLPPIRRADGSPEEGERLTPQQIERIAAQGPTERRDEPFFDAASRTYVDVLTGRREPITEKDFTAKEQMAMMDAVRRSQARGGKGRVDYEDYPDSNTVGPGYVNIKNTLGGFQYKQGLDGSTIISDKYDFHGPRVAEYEKMGTGEKLVKSAKNALVEFVTSGGGVRDLAGELGRAYVGSKGPEVNIRIPVNRAEGSPPTGERKLDRETMDMLRKQGTSPASLQRVAPPADINSSAAGLPGLMLLADPRIDNTNAYGYMLDGGDDTKNRAMAQAMFLNKSRSEDYPDTIAHETEHLLARQNLGSAANINSKFDELIGNKGTSRLNFVRDAVKAAPYLKEKYDLQSSYLDPKMFEYQSKFGLGKNLLYEQLASLSALEQRHKVDLTKDPELRKTLFSRPDVRETYNAITGLRQTRLDPRDLSPYTRVAEPGMLDAIKGVFKRADGGPVYRADGSPEEGERLTPQQIERIAAQELAEREALSTPAFIAQKSGIGRKAGPVSQALQSGQGYIEAAKGFTMLPQNLVGAAFDLSNMVAGIYGGNVDKPIFGSENLKEQSRKAGIAFKPSDDPTLAGFFGAADLGSNLVNPAGVTRAGVKAAEKTGEAAKMLARDFQQYNQELAVPGASYAVRNKGTPVAMSGRFNPVATTDEAEEIVKAVAEEGRIRLSLKDKPLGDWFSKTVTRYLRSDFATPQDQLVRAAEEGKILHVAPKEFSDSASDQVLKNFLERRQSDLEYMRQAEGFGNTNMATQPYGQRIEDLTDISAYPERVGDLTPNRVPPSMRNIVETRPETRVTDYAPGIVDNLKLDELRDKMLSVRQADGKYGAYGQPAVKIPAEFMLPDDTLAKLNVAAASNRMARYTNWQDETRQGMATTALRSDPQFTRAPLQEGKYLGVALPDIRQNPEIRQLVTDVGCDGGWCTRYSQNAKTYGGGFSRLHIIVTGEGKQARPVAQFAIADSGAGFEPSKRYSITEIKEKGNTADFANNPALPAIQEYVQFLEKSYGGLDYVDDLKGLRMTQLPEYPMQLLDLFNPTVQQRRMLEKTYGSELEGFTAVRDKAVQLNNGSRFMTGNEDAVANSLEQAMKLVAGPKENEARQIQMNLFQPPKEKALGGMIERQPNDNRRYL